MSPSKSAYHNAKSTVLFAFAWLGFCSWATSAAATYTIQTATLAPRRLIFFWSCLFVTAWIGAEQCRARRLGGNLICLETRTRSRILHPSRCAARPARPNEAEVVRARQVTHNPLPHARRYLITSRESSHRHRSAAHRWYDKGGCGSKLYASEGLWCARPSWHGVPPLK